MLDSGYYKDFVCNRNQRDLYINGSITLPNLTYAHWRGLGLHINIWTPGEHDWIHPSSNINHTSSLRPTTLFDIPKKISHRSKHNDCGCTNLLVRRRLDPFNHQSYCIRIVVSKNSIGSFDRNHWCLLEWNHPPCQCGGSSGRRKWRREMPSNQYMLGGF